jgi:hypothetical protein
VPTKKYKISGAPTILSENEVFRSEEIEEHAGRRSGQKADDGIKVNEGNRADEQAVGAAIEDKADGADDGKF